MAERGHLEQDHAYDRATARGRDRDITGPAAVGVHIDAPTRRLVIALDNGATFAVPWDRLQGLGGQTPAAIARFELSGEGHGLHWPDLDVDYTVPGLLAGRFGARGWSGTTDTDARAA